MLNLKPSVSAALGQNGLSLPIPSEGQGNGGALFPSSGAHPQLKEGSKQITVIKTI